MTTTKPTFGNLDWQAVDLKDLKGSIKSWCDERRYGVRGRYFILIQDRDGGGYEVIKQSSFAWPALRKVALGYVSEHLKRKYGQAAVADNVDVWIAVYDSDLWKEELENLLLGQWANLEAQDARCRKIAKAIENSPGRKKFWSEAAPDAYAYLLKNKYL